MFAVSDIHVDYPQNMTWVESVSPVAHREDALIVAGDVTHDLGRLERALATLRARFALVSFVPGNHELWVRGDDCAHSVEKFERIEALCRRLDVAMRPRRFGRPGDDAAVWVVPLQSWYVEPEEGDDSLFEPKPGEDPTLGMWSDKFFVRWPGEPGFGRPADHFLAMNEPLHRAAFDAPVITFSHMLPRGDLMRSTAEERARLGPPPPDAYPEFNFSRVAGCHGLEAQLRRAGATVHVYGHQHRNRWREVDGVLYVSNCLGYPGRDQHANPRRLWQIWGDGADEGIHPASVTRR